MDFKLDKVHQLQQQLFRNFAETEIKPLAKDMDEAEAYDMDLLAKICNMLEDEEVLEKLKTTNDLDWVMQQLS